MNKLYSAILAIAAVLFAAPVVNAQYTNNYEGIGTLTFPHETPGNYGTNTDVGVSKNISSPVNGTYWIKLEAFAQGEATKTSTPCDFVLVLDISGSMRYDMDGTTHTNYDASSTKTRMYALKQAVKSFIDQVNENDKKDMGGNTRSARLGHQISIVTFATNAEVQKVNNQSMVKLGTSLTNDSGATSLKSIVDGLTPNGGTYAHKGMAEAYTLISGLTSDRKLRTVVLFTDGVPGLWGEWTSSDYSSSTSIYNWPERENYGNTYRIRERVDTYNTANATINTANNIKLVGVNGIVSNVFTVSVITSPGPQTQVYLGKTSSNYIGATNMGDWNGTWNNTTTMWNNGNGTKNTDGTNYALTATTAEELKSAFDAIAGITGKANNEELSSTTSTIDVVSSSFTLSGTTVSKDMIKVYTAPYLFNKETKQLYFGTEKLAKSSTDMFDYYTYTTGTDGTIIKTFVRQKDVDDEIDIDEDKLADNIVEVIGFDYTNNWCGPIKEDGRVVGAQGHKLIILIPISMSETAVGGPNVTTNAPGSGIYKEGATEPFIDFKSPTVSLPVNLGIKKEVFVNANTNKALPNGENAKFVIKRGIIAETRPEDADETWHPDYSKITNWQYVTSIFYPNKNGDDYVLIKGLPSTSDEGDYVYQIIEEDWGWTYTFDSATGKGYVKKSGKVEIDDISITNKKAVYSDQFVVNPIIFVNKEEADSDQRVRHAESKVTNTFKTGGGKTWSDSKNQRQNN